MAYSPPQTMDAGTEQSRGSGGGDGDGDGDGPSKAATSPGTLPKPQQDAHYQRHLSQPLNGFGVGLRQLSQQQSADVLRSIKNVAPPLADSFGNVLGALRQARRTEYALATRAPAPFEPSFTKLPGASAAVAVAPEISKHGRGHGRRSSSSSSGKPRQKSSSFSSTPKKKKNSTSSSGGRPPVVPFSADVFPERPLPDAASLESTTSSSSRRVGGGQVIALKLDNSPSQQVKRLSRQEEIQNRMRDKEWVTLADPSSRNSWAAERFYILQQCPCKEFVVGIIREIDPVKQRKTPYRQKGDTIVERPPYWPKDVSVRHTVTPSHLKKEERVDLLVHLLYLPDNDPQFYERWKAEHPKARGRRHKDWADMLRFVADGTTFRTDGPKLTPKAKAMSRGFNVDSSGALYVSADDQIVKLDRSKFDVTKDEKARIEARLELVSHLISAAAKVEQGSGGGLTKERVRLPPLPDYFFQRELGHQMRQTRVPTGRKRKRSPDDDSTAAGDFGPTAADDEEEDDDDGDDGGEEEIEVEEDGAGDHDHNHGNDNDGNNNNYHNDDAFDSQSVAPTEAYSIADGTEKQQQEADHDAFSDGTRTEVASLAGDQDDVGAALDTSRSMTLDLQQQGQGNLNFGYAYQQPYRHQNVNRATTQQHQLHQPLNWPNMPSTSSSHYQQAPQMTAMQTPQPAMSTSFQGDASAYGSQTSTPQDMYNMMPHDQQHYLSYVSPEEQDYMPDASFIELSSMGFGADQTAASSSFTSEAYSVDMMPGYYDDEGAPY